MLTHDIYDMVLTIADRAVTDIHLDRKLRATFLAADETARSEISYMLSDELAIAPWPAERLPRTIERIQRFIPSRLWAHWSRLMRRASSVLAEGSAPRSVWRAKPLRRIIARAGASAVCSP